MIEETRALESALQIIESMTANQPNEWVPVFATCLGAFVGFGASLIATFSLEKRKAKNLLTSLKTEISAHLEIFKYREYHQSINKIIEELKEEPSDTQYAFSVIVPDHYSRIYQANCSEIGSVSSKDAKKIVTYHQLIDSVVQDVSPNGIIGQGGTLKQYVELERILSKALVLARKIA